MTNSCTPAAALRATLTCQTWRPRLKPWQTEYGLVKERLARAVKEQEYTEARQLLDWLERIDTRQLETTLTG
jgi:hypothetical protein